MLRNLFVRTGFMKWGPDKRTGALATEPSSSNVGCLPSLPVNTLILNFITTGRPVLLYLIIILNGETRGYVLKWGMAISSYKRAAYIKLLWLGPLWFYCTECMQYT